jgi:diguanylate cyclase (GGDEF)-like protein
MVNMMEQPPHHRESSPAARQISPHEVDQLVAQRTAELKAVIQELETAKKQAEIDALQDPLTKLPNRRLFQGRLTLAIKHAERTPGYLCALLYLDIDRFKIVNDSLGHLAGDELLMGVARILESCLRGATETSGRTGQEDFVARLGGDEFAIFLDNIHDASDALRIADRIGEKLSAPFVIRGKQIPVTVSIGIAVSSTHYASAENMLRDADTAMYRAKAAGRNGCILFDESMHLSAVKRLYRESEMRQAFDKREFFLCYQPIFSLSDRKIEVVEALLRWRSPTSGILLPEDFIHLAEETGLIVPLGAWALREACEQIGRWRLDISKNFPLTVGVNISSRQLAHPSFAATVKQILQDCNIESRYLRLELSESVAMGTDRHAPVLSDLQELGVRLSIDDFGTGYSSLRYLHRYSVDTLKIDRGLVASMERDQRDRNIVRTIISLAHNLQMKAVAEGVETPGQAELLTIMGCDYVQGHLFARPMNAQGVTSWLMDNPSLYLHGVASGF